MTSDVHEIGSNAATVARSQTRSDKVEADLAVHPDKWRILTGDRPTGSLHIGHYCGCRLVVASQRAALTM